MCIQLSNSPYGAAWMVARDKPGMYQHQREVENSISITMQSYTHVGWRHNGPGVTGAPL